MPKRLTTTGHATAEAIANRDDFTTSGSLKGQNVSGLGPWDSGRLFGPDHDRFREDSGRVDYVVTSYATPIAWHTPDGWHIVDQRFSVTTSRQQGNLYLCSPVVSGRGAGVSA